jgi:Flp pilus assembly protein TadB
VTVLAGILLAAAVALAVPPSRLDRLHALVPRPRESRHPRGVPPPAAGAAAGLAAFVLVGGLPGIALAVGLVVLVPRVVARLEPRSRRMTRLRLAGLVPLVADLLAATLASGAPLGSALRATADAVGDPARTVLAPVLAASDLGSDDPWQSVRGDPLLGALAAAASRSARTGAPLAAVLAGAADDARRARQREVEVAARSAGVRAVLPLAACFLPAFLLVGVVPIVASLITDVLP